MTTEPVATIEDALLEHLRAAFDSLADSVRDLDPAGLDAIPGSETNSIAVLVVHTIETARSILHEVVGEPLPRDRDAEFKVAGLSGDDLLERLTEWSTEMDELVRRALAEPLEREIRRYRVATSAWWLLQVLGHTREHAAHAALTRQLLADRTPSSPS